MADGHQCASLLITPTILLQHYHRACLWSRRIFHRDKWLNFIYSRSHAFRYRRMNTIQYNILVFTTLLHYLFVGGIRGYLVDHSGDEIEGQDTTCVANSAAGCHHATSHRLYNKVLVPFPHEANRARLRTRQKRQPLK